jgi:hypothetical protein
MKRIALFAAAVSMLGTGCTVTTDNGTNPGVGTVNFYWQFERTKLDRTTVVYDPSTGVFTGSGTCPKSDIDTVKVQLPDGSIQTFSCITQGVQGIQINGLPAGSQTFQLSGYRGGVELYWAQQTVNVPDGASVSQDVSLFGLTGALDVFPIFSDAVGQPLPQYSGTCNDVSTLNYVLEDSARTTIASGSVPCTGAGTIRFSGPTVLDLDTYTIRLQGFIGASTVETFDSETPPACAAQSFNHFGANDTGGSGWAVTMYDTSGLSAVCQ